MGCYQSKGATKQQSAVVVEATRTGNAAAAFYQLSPDCIANIYSKLENPSDRCNFYHSCHAVRVPQVQCQIRKALLFHTPPQKKLWRGTVDGPHLEAALCCPGTAPDILSVHIPHWRTMVSGPVDEEVTQAKYTRQALDSPRVWKLLRSIRHVHLADHWHHVVSLPLQLLQLCSQLNTISGVTLLFSDGLDTPSRQLLMQTPHLKRVEARVVKADGPPDLPGKFEDLEWQVGNLVLEHASLAPHYAHPRFASQVHSLTLPVGALVPSQFWMPGALEHLPPEASEEALSSLVSTFPCIRRLKLVGSVGDIVPFNVSLTCLSIASRGWHSLEELVLVAPDEVFFLDPAVELWLLGACHVLQASCVLPHIQITLHKLSSGWVSSSLMASLRALLTTCREAVEVTAHEDHSKVRIVFPALSMSAKEIKQLALHLKTDLSLNTRAYQLHPYLLP